MADTDFLDPSLPPQDPQHVTRSIRINILWKLVGTVGVQSIRFVIVAVLARLLGPADYGSAAIPIALASFAPTLGDMGLGASIVQAEHVTPRVRSTAVWGALAFGAALTVVFAVTAGPVARFLEDPRAETLVLVGAVTFLIYSLGSTRQAVFMRTMNFRALELRYMLALVIAGALAIVGAAGGLGPWALVLQQVVLAATFVAALWWRADWSPAFEFSGVVFRQLIGYGLRVAGGRAARLAELLVLSLLIGKLVGIESLGIWTFAMTMVILPLGLIAIPVGEVLFSAFSRMRGDPVRVSALWLDTIGLLAAILFPLLAGLIVVAPEVIPLAFGRQWSAAVPIVQILSVYVIIRGLQAMNSIVLDAVGKPQVTMWTQTAALCLTPVAIVVGAQWGLEAAAVGFVVSQLIAVEVPSLVFVLLELRMALRTAVARLSGVATAALIMAIACLGARLGLIEVGVDDAARAALTVSLGLLVYPAAIWFLAPDIRNRGVGLARTSLARVARASTRTS